MFARLASSILLPLALIAQTPLPVEIPVPPVSTTLEQLPQADQLPRLNALPDVMIMNDGTEVTSPAQWSRRRTELQRTLAFYATGRMPPAPGNVQGSVLSTELVADGQVRYRLLRLAFGPDAKLTLHVGLFTPAARGASPAIILQGGTPPGAPSLPRLPPGPNQGRGENVLFFVGPGPTAQQAATRAPRTEDASAAALVQRHADVFRRGYALAIFNPNDCAEDTTLREPDGSWSFRTTRFLPAYPGYDWGILAVWAWGASRLADYLATDPAIDHSKLIVVTGASRYGKAAMIAAAFDERLLGAPVVTGGGGLGAYRHTGPRKSETLDLMVTKYPNWFSPHLHPFRGQRERLPFDQHWFIALCAPRPFLALEGDTDTISLPTAVQASFQGAEPAYALLGATGRLGVHYAHHGHAFTTEDWTALLDFSDFQLFRKGLFTSDPFPTDAALDAAAAKAQPHSSP